MSGLIAFGQLPAPALARAAAAAAAPASQTAAAATTEPVANAYVGTPEYAEVLFNIDFSDLGGAWYKDAVYEGGALDIIKGFGAGAFEGASAMTNAQALALVFRAAGMEELAQQTGEDRERAARALGAARSAPDTVWVNGCLQLALDEGLISADDYGAATGNAAAMGRTAFRRDGAAQRQAFAYWMAMELGISPVRGQQAIFNSYKDWRSADAMYVPYIEGVLRERVMSGDSDGSFRPLAPITRGEAAQAVKNASPFVQSKNGLGEASGAIERIWHVAATEPTAKQDDLDRTVIYIRNSKGTLDTITLEYAVSSTGGAAAARRRTTGLVAARLGELADETDLKLGDQVRYIFKKSASAASPDSVRFMQVLSAARADSFVLAQIERIDTGRRQIAFTQFYPVALNSAGEARQIESGAPEGLSRLHADYGYSGDIEILIDGKRSTLDKLAVGMNVIIGIESGNMVYRIETTGTGINLGRSGVVKGIIEENNPVLGYISMYSEPGAAGGMKSELRIYSYTDAAGIDIRKDGAPAGIEDILAGNSAYIKLDGDGEAVAISAVENYRARYGTVESVAAGSLALRLGDGSLHNVELGPDVLYFRDYALVGRSALAAGAEVRVLSRDTGGGSEAAEITINGMPGGRGQVGSVYKAVLSRIDETSKNAVIYNVLKLNKGKWENVSKKGFGTIPITADTRIYLNDTSYTPAKLNKLLRDSEVYIAAKNDYGGREVAALLSVKGADSKEQIYDDYIKSVRVGAGGFGLASGPQDIGVAGGTIVIKDGMLVTGASIASDDQAYVVASRDDASGRMKAEVVEIADRPGGTGPAIYRGRISKVAPGESFTLESFSELLGTEWRYANTPKTFSTNFGTLLLADGGAAPMREFEGRGENSYIGRTVYVAADGNTALAISTAPYGIQNVRGEIHRLDGATLDEDGKPLTPPTAMLLTGAMVYDRATYAWKNMAEPTIAIGANALVLRNGELAAARDLAKGDRVRVLKVDTAATGAGLIIIVEN
ncbi:MAG: S-layer homology domain-containing protein [Clostridiales bacterium]|nr:S-layer homology domain-containing protein [Clostridiales bacterium]